MTHPSVNSIVERLEDHASASRAAALNPPRPTTSSGWLQAARDFSEAATTISELQAQNERLQRALMFWMPGVDLRLDEATREQCANDAGLLAGYSGPLAGRRWGNEIIDAVAGLQAECVDKAAAWDALAEKNAKIAALESSLSRIKAETIEECARVAENFYQNKIGKQSFGPSMQDGIASAIRSLGSTGGGDAEEGSTQKEGSE